MKHFRFIETETYSASSAIFVGHAKEVLQEIFKKFIGIPITGGIIECLYTDLEIFGYPFKIKIEPKGVDQGNTLEVQTEVYFRTKNGSWIGVNENEISFELFHFIQKALKERRVWVDRETNFLEFEQIW